MRASRAWCVVSLLFASSATHADVESSSAKRARLENRLATLSAGEDVHVAGEPIVARFALPRLYAATGGRLFWVDEARWTALLAAIRAAPDDGLTSADYHLAALEQLATAADRGVDADLLATDAYLLLLRHLYLGKVDPVSIEPNWNVPLRPVREQDALHFVSNAITSGQIRESAASLRPKHWLYEAERAALARYSQIARDGGWPSIPGGGSVALGAVDSRVPALRRRLAITGDYAGTSSDSTEFDPVLVDAVKVFQGRHLLPIDGEVGPATLRELNVPVEQRVTQLRLNLERSRWVLHAISPDDLVIVDVAGNGIRYLRGHTVIWSARAIVGQPARQTPVFQAEIDSVVFNPTWTVPPGILARDILPQVQRGEDVLARKELHVYELDGRSVDPANVSWSAYTPRNFPYLLRQDSGDRNPLGRVKINFPNPYLVYIHDTPTRALFGRPDRFFSSGCIRIDRPLELTELLLADPVRWDASAIRAAINAGKTRTVWLPRKIPVLLVYWTAEIEADGRVIFKRDVYRRDEKLRRALDGQFKPGRQVKF